MTTVLETVSYRAPLALQAFDAVTLVAVSDGLVATAWPQGQPDAARTAKASPFSSLLGFGTLPALRAQEYVVSPGSTQPTWPAAAAKPFVVTVVDTLGRYLPEVFVVHAPVPAPIQVKLYSSPARPLPGGLGVLYGEAHLSTDATPAGWAYLTFGYGTSTYTAVCDAAGRFRLFLPYPDALPPLSGVNQVGNGIGTVSWVVTCGVRCQPSALAWPGTPAPQGPPDIDTVRAQAPALVALTGPAHASVDLTLQFGTTLPIALTVTPA